VIVVRRLRRDFEAMEQDGERHTVQRLMPKSIVVAPVVATRSCAGVARDRWVTTMATPWEKATSWEEPDEPEKLAELREQEADEK
jgi:hypothetical protein